MTKSSGNTGVLDALEQYLLARGLKVERGDSGAVTTNSKLGSTTTLAALGWDIKGNLSRSPLSSSELKNALSLEITRNGDTMTFSPPAATPPATPSQPSYEPQDAEEARGYLQGQSDTYQDAQAQLEKAKNARDAAAKQALAAQTALTAIGPQQQKAAQDIAKLESQIKGLTNTPNTPSTQERLTKLRMQLREEQERVGENQEVSKRAATQNLLLAVGEQRAQEHFTKMQQNLDRARLGYDTAVEHFQGFEPRAKDALETLSREGATDPEKLQALKSLKAMNLPLTTGQEQYLQILQNAAAPPASTPDPAPPPPAPAAPAAAAATPAAAAPAAAGGGGGTPVAAAKTDPAAPPAPAAGGGGAQASAAKLTEAFLKEAAQTWVNGKPDDRKGVKMLLAAADAAGVDGKLLKERMEKLGDKTLVTGEGVQRLADLFKDTAKPLEQKLREAVKILETAYVPRGDRGATQDATAISNAFQVAAAAMATETAPQRTVASSEPTAISASPTT